MSAGTRNLLIGFIQDFILGAGGIITTAMGVKGEFVMPSPAVIVFAIIMGAMAATRRAQSKTEPSVSRPEPAMDADIAALADAVSKAIHLPMPVTPARVPDTPPLPAAPVKVGGSA